MTDERGGRYFREARFFFLGDKPLAQSHVPEARAMLGYLRDMHAMGGPPIQVKYATLQDGTKIKAVMMNGQYQAEIISRQQLLQDNPGNIPTLAGHTFDSGISLRNAQAFKWQKKTGVVFLPYVEDYNTSYPLSVSADGSMVAGKMEKYVVVGLNSILEKSTWVYWDAENIPHLVPAIDYAHILDVQNKQTELIDAVPSILDIQGTQSRFGIPAHRYAKDVKHQYFGYASPGFSAAVVDMKMDGTEVVSLHETGAPGGYSIINQADYSGNAMVGEYGAGAVVTWRRPRFGEAYVREAIHPSFVTHTVPSCISGNGKVVGAAFTQIRNYGAIVVVDAVPVIWSERYGLEQLEQFQASPGNTDNPVAQDQGVAAITYDGTVAGGREALNPTPLVKAWSRDNESNTWAPIPGFSGTFNGQCLVAN